MDDERVETGEREPEYTFDLSTMEPARMTDCHQEGNYLVVTTDKGIKFRQRIPQGKILNKVNGKFVFEEMVVR